MCIRDRDGGIIVISTWDSKEGYFIKVSDNGAGFIWKEQIDYNDGKLHIGIKNVRNRLETMVGGSLEIQSKIGEGTVATIRIPKNLPEPCKIKT